MGVFNSLTFILLTTSVFSKTLENITLQYNFNATANVGQRAASAMKSTSNGIRFTKQRTLFPKEESTGLLENLARPGYCLGVQGSSFDDGAELAIFECDNSPDKNQALVNINALQNYDHAPGQLIFNFNGKCVDNPGWGTDNGVRLDQWTCADQDNHRWRLTSGTFETSFQLQNVFSLKCLVSEANGEYIDQWECEGLENSPHQYWKIRQDVKAVLQNVKHFDKCLHVKDSSADNGAELELFPCNPNAVDQQMNLLDWANYATTPGLAKIKFSGKCLNVWGNGMENGARIVQWDCGDFDNEKLKIINGEYGDSFQLQMVSSGKCVAAEADGEYIDQWDCEGVEASPHQAWRIVIIQPAPPVHGTYLENAQYPGQCLHVTDVSDPNANSVPLELFDCGSIGTLIKLEQIDWDNLFTSAAPIQFSYNTNKCIDVYGGGTSSGDKVNMYDCNNGGNQKWTASAENSENQEFFQLIGQDSSKCITAEDAGRYIDQWECYPLSNSRHQFWRALSPFSGGEQHDPIPPGFTLQNVKYDTKCLHLKDGSAADNAELDLVECDFTALYQLVDGWNWENYDREPGPVVFVKTDKCMVVKDINHGNGEHVVQKPCQDDQGEQFWQIYNGNYRSQFQLRNAITKRCLTAESEGAYMDQWDCESSSSTHQYWSLRKTGTVIKPVSITVNFILESFAYPDKCVILKRREQNRLNDFDLAPCNTIDPYQRFDYDSFVDSNILRVLPSSKILSGSDTVGNNVVQYYRKYVNSEYWYIIDGTIDSTFRLRLSRTDARLCMTWENKYAYNNNLQIYPCNDQNDHMYTFQKFKIRRVPPINLKDYTCGPNNGNRKCAGQYEGMCCSIAGFCGLGEIFCRADRCQDNYGGHCENNLWYSKRFPNDINWDRPFNWDGRCGSLIRKKCTGIAAGKCCSEEGFCSDASFNPGGGPCSVRKGCQIAWSPRGTCSYAPSREALHVG